MDINIEDDFENEWINYYRLRKWKPDNPKDFNLVYSKIDEGNMGCWPYFITFRKNNPAAQLRVKVSLVIHPWKINGVRTYTTSVRIEEGDDYSNWHNNFQNGNFKKFIDQYQWIQDYLNTKNLH